MQVVSKSFLLTAACSLLLALFVMYVLLVHKGIKSEQRKVYMFGFGIVWTMFNIIAL